EVVQLVPAADAKEAAEKISHYFSVLLKGGHNEEEQGVDYLYYNGKVVKLNPNVVTVFPKHGSGCVLSSAITANIALGYGLEEACSKAKVYTEKF
ncbi:bifunctional hydroxymethylpyrimidine kinase/phosphomethylpyrimidine kinase, partial [Staphylococcus aureus]